jgi:acyl-CoA thioester hydrolase
MYQHNVELRVRYGETDQMGYLYYGNYAQYFEIGRVELIRSLGLTYKEMEEVHGIWLPVVEMQVKYLKPVFYDDLVTVQTQVRALPDRFITFYTEVTNQSGKLVNTAEVKLCFFHAEQKKVVSAPDFLMAELRPYFEKK